MSDQIEVKRQAESMRVPSVTGLALESPEIAQEQNKRTLKGMLMMVVCCTAPLFLLAAVPFLGATFGSLVTAGSGLLSVVALLACPIGMYLMMRMIRNERKSKER